MAKETESPSAGASGDGRARALLPAERSRDSERRDAICRRNVRMMLVFQARARAGPEVAQLGGLQAGKLQGDLLLLLMLVEFGEVGRVTGWICCCCC